ncbi:TPA: DUF2304 domain-containing protein [Streptococcus equi subsp. zooepidemicus]|uniref:DUF2304 domain-containing protein n=2 Tax=Streptococcus equi TaxID=1336 RepID=A0A6M1L235_9STRE|nr:DUF2304 domain-containing protein [Streptococcus equi]AEJ25138.1 membrane protein [Streptococcus equi subsp. zooepidemicus ATCC 35246]AIA67717.1 glycosyl transferase [Streptococcus equi subsp. zooepidemicus CY]KIS07901.1 membrane protein [Streptococcus equi subsp. zooepidemicus Sz5]MBR7683384.1 DUF2304 domain-containing protein [Streptococcus equi subsp. zooepidemicus]MBR7752422.1 DUF2304 domain-containing protein [Streptococcus equi subsp. zooepidemicus]
MFIGLQLILIIVALLTAMFILDSIRRSKILIEDSFFWLFFSLIVLLLSLFPNAAVYFSRLLGFESPANFVFLSIIFLLIINQFFITQKLSRTEIKLKKMIQYLALNEKEKQEQDENQQ